MDVDLFRFYVAERAELESDTDISVRSAKPAAPEPSGFTLHLFVVMPRGLEPVLPA